MSVYLGFDLSTQSLTAIAIEIEGARRQVIFERSLGFDADLPHYRTSNGVLPQRDPSVATSSPRMWAEALDRMMGIIARESGIDLSHIRAISGSAQQHGSVYLDSSAVETLANLHPETPLVDQIQGIFSRETAPIWMDSSTASQCVEITRAVGGDEALARLTGSRAFERFTGPQIRKFAEEDPEGWARTEKVHLVSSYLASLLLGKHAPIEPADGAGMNLMDIRAKQWAPVALHATAPGLDARLPELVESWAVVGRLAPYWVRRYGFPNAKVVACSGDNPSSLIGAGLIEEGRIGISLGTSDTLFGFLPKPRVDPSGAGHVFGSPTGDWMSLVCFRNGSLARERVRQEQGLDWDGFSRALRETEPGNRGAIMLPWFEPEITPPVTTPGVRRYGLASNDGPATVRAVVEAQMLAMALHSAWTGVRVNTIHATGGAARNHEILRVMADVFDSDVYELEVGNSACLGAALRAWHGDQVSLGRPLGWDQVVAGFAEPVAESRLRPIPEHARRYAELRKIYAACEAHALGGGENPLALIEAFRGRSAG